MILATLFACATLQGALQATPAQPRYAVDPETGRAVGATEMAPESLRLALHEGRNVYIIDTRPAEAFEKETLPGAVNIPLAELDARLAAYPKDALLVFT